MDRDAHYTLGDAFDEIRTLSGNNHERVVPLREVAGVSVDRITIVQRFWSQ